MEWKKMSLLSVLMLTSIAFASWYPQPSNNTTGIFGMINATKNGMEAQIGGVGGNLIGISLLLPLWLIVFLMLSKFNVEAAFVVTNFVCWLVSIYLIMLGMIHEIAFLIFGILWVMGAVGYYLHTRQ